MTQLHSGLLLSRNSLSGEKARFNIAWRTFPSISHLETHAESGE